MFAGRYYNGHDARALPVECAIDDGVALAIRGDGFERRVPLADIRVSPRLARTQRSLTLPDGAQIHSDDNDAIDAIFPGRNRLEALVDRLERHSRAVAASIIVTVAAAVLFFHTGLPWLADRVARRIPESVQQAMGDQTLALLHRVLKPTALPEEKRLALRDRFGAFLRDVPGAQRYRLEFFAAPGIGANAFALPGGTIVFTDEMVGMLNDDDEFLAVAAHEIGHEQHRHLLRSVLQDSAIIVIGAMFAGDVGSAGTIVIGMPTFLLQSHYSRGFEADADDYAFAALAAHGISPLVFAAVMRKFQEKHPDLKGGMLAYASTHPPTDERIRRAEQAARSFVKP